MKTAVVLIIFNRPDTTRQVFSAIAAAKPPRLFVVADGPRTGRDDDAARCEEARAIARSVDWDCELLLDLSDINLGSRKRVITGLDWVFSFVDAAMILEDDCVPDATFFPFCEELLDRYRDDERIAMIAGSNFQPHEIRVPASYYFSRYTNSWGWATWRRAWRLYDRSGVAWPLLQESSFIEATASSAAERRFWEDIFGALSEGKLASSWDYHWLLTAWSQNMLSVVPRTNLITNIGFGADATHTIAESRVAHLPRRPMPFPLVHPEQVFANSLADRNEAAALFSKSLRQELASRLKGYLPLPVLRLAKQARSRIRARSRRQ